MNDSDNLHKKNFRSELTIVEDRARIANLLAQGYRSRTEIAKIINQERSEDVPELTPAHVSNDIEYMKKKAAEQGVEDYSVYRAETLAEINMLMRTAWEAYHLSRRNKITIESESIVDEEQFGELQGGLHLAEGEKVFERMAKVREEQRLDGNPAFLTIVANCTDRKAKIYGVDAPSKMALTDVSGQKDASNILDFMHQQIDELSTKHEQRQLAAMKAEAARTIEEPLSEENSDYIDAEFATDDE